LVLTSVFPNTRRPDFGIFIHERVVRVARHCEVSVVAPVPWFPFDGPIRTRGWGGIPPLEHNDRFPVYHPRFLCVPAIFKCLDGVFYASSLVRFLRRLDAQFPFDLIDAHFAYPDGVAAALLGKALGRPVVITLRGSIMRLARYALHRPQLRYALATASRVLAVSESLKAVALRLGIPEERVRVIPNGVDTTLFRPSDRRRAREACGLPHERTIILTVGAVCEAKGQHLVVDALAEIVARRPDVLYVIVGEVDSARYRRRLQDSITRAGLSQHVLFAGPQRHTQLPRWYAAADVFCLATRSEGRANVLLEALACGVPVVTTAVGGNPEIVRDARYGILVPFRDVRRLRDAISTALDSDWDGDELAAYTSEFSWDRTGAEVVKEFDNVLTDRATCIRSS
jgi:teichuronic acid biosynthesis glycosyltransferase TuaC